MQLKDGTKTVVFANCDCGGFAKFKFFKTSTINIPRTQNRTIAQPFKLILEHILQTPSLGLTPSPILYRLSYKQGHYIRRTDFS